MKLTISLVLFIFASSCSSSSTKVRLYTSSSSLVTTSEKVELPGTICVTPNSCRDYVSRWQSQTMSLERFKLECQGGSIVEASACIRRGYGCIQTESNSTPTGGYTTISMIWGEISPCTDKFDPELNEI